MPLKELARDLPLGLDSADAKNLGWTFLPGPDKWLPPEGYGRQETQVARAIWKNWRDCTQYMQIVNINTEAVLIAQVPEVAYFSFSGQQLFDLQAPSDRTDTTRRIMMNAGLQIAKLV